MSFMFYIVDADSDILTDEANFSICQRVGIDVPHKNDNHFIYNAV